MKLFAMYFCKSLRAMKSHVVILFLLNFLSAFMYYFVEASVDGNMLILGRKAGLNEVEQELLVSLQSNRTLAFSFLILLTLIAAFVHFMFYKQYSSFHQKELGVYISCGCSAAQMAGAVFLISVCFGALAHFPGLCLGWFGSDILLNHYKEAYDLQYVVKGLNTGSFLSAFLIGGILPAVTALPVIHRIGRSDTSDLLSGNIHNKDVRIGNMLRVLTKNTGFSVRLALRKPFQLLMSFFAVGLFSILFVMSASLNLSSSYVFSTQTAGRSYEYDLTFASFQPAEYEALHAEDSDAKTPTGDRYLAVPANICLDGKTIGVTMTGIGKDNRFFTLLNQKNQSLMDIPEDGIVISQALSELYGIKRGSVLSVDIEDKKAVFHVSGIAENGEHYVIYTAKGSLEKLFGLAKGAFNGLYTDSLSQVPQGTGVKVQSITGRKEELNKNQVSNRMSAVICQILGCVIGCLLLYLTILLKFQEDTKNIFILDMLGYSAKQINRMFVSVYRPILNMAFILLLLPVIAICKSIHKSLSLATDDYIPFQSNVFLLAAIWVLLNFVYTLVKHLFHIRIERLQKSGETVKYLN